MKRLLVLCMMLISTICIGQLTDYDKYEIEQRKADSLLIVSKNKEAAIHLKNAIKLKPHVTSFPYKLLAEIYVKEKKYYKSYFVLKKSILNTGHGVDILKNNKNLVKLLPISYWDKLEKEEYSLKIKYFTKHGNLNAYFEMELLQERDQVFRYLPYIQEEFSAEEMQKFKQLYPQFDKINEKEIDKGMILQDFRNISDLIEYAKKYGYQKGMYLLLWHQRGNYGENNFIWEFFKPFLNEEIKKGNITRSFWCAFDDFLSYKNTGEQIYGEYEFGEVDKTTVNIRRKEVNLPPLTDEQIDAINSRVYN